MLAPRKNQAQQKRQSSPVPLTRTFTGMPLFANYRSKADYPAPPRHPQLQTPYPARHGLDFPQVLPLFTPPHAESTHGGHSWRLAYLLLFTRGHGGEGYQRAANHPKTNSILPPPPFLLSAVDSFHKPRFAKPIDKVYYGNITLAFM